MIARRFGSTVHRDRQAVNGNCVGHGVDPPMSTQALGQLNSILEGSNLTPILLSRLGNRANLLEKCGFSIREITSFTGRHGAMLISLEFLLADKKISPQNIHPK